jgi:hypothetical protein
MPVQITINHVTNGYILNVADEDSQTLAVAKNAEEVRTIVGKALKAFFSTPTGGKELEG